MKIYRFNEIKFDDFRLAIDKFQQAHNANIQLSDDKFPFKCKFKNREPDPGICYIISIDFENRKVSCLNGSVRLYPSFDEIEFVPDIFVFSKYNL